MIGKIKNLLCGASTIMSLYPNMRDDPRMRFLDRSDAEALHDDWVKVGEDLRKATSQYEQEHETTALTTKSKQKPHSKYKKKLKKKLISD